ncbi:MAG: extracellular solute-binding protein [Candidatus Fournierella pullistercoris]|uniref:Extracellular solute-binding protein n=1 Tax=Candidatus Allofournierella pullistercoris TaxID=2838597 RepID=A0A948T2W3_9FIRM|nr:extracellular solute-binding protein [Candidatus Fournierella pullistercoris]
MKKLIPHRRFLCALLSVLMAGSMVACGGSPASSSGTTGSAPGSQASSGAESWGDVTLTMWGAEEDQTMLREMADAFIKANADKGNITINIGACSEANAKDNILVDPTAAADVFAFADDQLNELVAAGALQEVLLNPDDVKSRNLAGSVEAASLNGKLYAYPMTADNGYFLYYDSSAISEEDAKSVDGILAAAKAAGRTFDMTINDAWYIYSFFAGAGLEATLAQDGVNTICNWNEAPGADVAQAIMDIAGNESFRNAPDADIVSGIADGSVCAAISGTWNAGTAQDAWGENYRATKLPTFTMNGEQVQMGSFSGYKLVGVNPHSANVGVAMMLADFITNEENQLKRFEDRNLGPSNINVSGSEAVQSAPAIAALALQSEFADLQRVGANYWDPAASLGQILMSGDTQGKTTQQLVDDAVAGITAPVTQ